MARKLSSVARHQLSFSIPLTAVAWSFVAPTIWADDVVRATDHPSVIQNPFASPPGRVNASPTASDALRGPAATGLPPAARSYPPQTPSARASKLATTPTSAPRIQRNPFARQPASPPPIAAPIMPGPISRWRDSVPVASEELRVKSAILAADPTPKSEIPAAGTSKPSNVPWDRLPPAELMRDRHAQGSPANQWSAQRTSDHAPSISISDLNLSQPASLVPDDEAPEPIPGSIAPPNSDRITFDPFEASAEDARANVDEPATFVIAHSDGISSQSPLAAPIEPDTTSVIVSDYVDTPAGWQARAEQTAQSAQTAEEFTAVIQDCQRCLKAGADLQVAATVNRLAAWAYNRRGELATEEGRDHDALRDFQSAIELDPECCLAIHNRGVTLAQHHELEMALDDFNRVIELNPGLVIVYRNRAELLASLDRMEEALRDYDAAIDQAPEDAGLYLGRGYAFHRIGDFDRALGDLNRSIELAGDRPEAYTQRGNLHAERGEFAEAVDDLKRALEIDPNFAEAHRSAAWFLATCPDPEYRDAAQALAAAQQAVELTPVDDCFMLDTLAAAHASAGQFDKAIDVQQQAIATAPPDLSPSLEQRLALYQQRQAFRSGRIQKVQPASHESSTARPSNGRRARTR